MAAPVGAVSNRAYEKDGSPGKRGLEPRLRKRHSYLHNLTDRDAALIQWQGTPRQIAEKGAEIPGTCC